MQIALETVNASTANAYVSGVNATRATRAPTVN